ncbi:Ribosomal protein L44, mitochondrial [Aphelenchoides bicaudatus]|nr:Ribosomal protein L44, mitochondrial [Aphelenchoides bicaudatus]
MLAQKLLAKDHRLPVLTACRFIRSVWERNYLKDLYHRRQLIGADPLISRSAYPNWNYPSEISALKHRIDVPEFDTKLLVQTLTNPSFFDRADVLGEASGAQPSREETIEGNENNTEFIDSGEHRMAWQLSSILRHRWPKAPEEFIQIVVEKLLDPSLLVTAAEHLSIQHLVRTSEFPPSVETKVDALKALVGALSPKRVHSFICEFILPPISNFTLEDVMPFREPLPILEDYLKAEGVEEVEPRLLHSSGVDSFMPLYVVGIFADKELVGQSPGERLSIAVDLAAQDSLLKVWGVRWVEQSYNFVNSEIPNSFEKPNHHLSSIVQKDRDTSLLTWQEMVAEPIDKVAVAQNYANKILPETGVALRRRARHKFSRGTLAKRSFRYLVKPRPFTI